MNELKIKKQSKGDGFKSRGDEFITYILSLTSNTAKMAALKRADNPALEYQSWEILHQCVDLTLHDERRIYCLIGAAAAKGKISEHGSLGIGAAIAKCYEKKSQSDQACAKLRRLIACDSVEEVCAVLRPLLQFILSNVGNTLNYGRLLDNLLQFQRDPLNVKARWVQNFYNQQPSEEDEHVC